MSEMVSGRGRASPTTTNHCIIPPWEWGKRGGSITQSFVQYDLDGRSSVAAVAESLLANEKLIKEAALLLEALFPGLVIEQTTVSVRRIGQESPLTQAFVAALVVAFQPCQEQTWPSSPVSPTRPAFRRCGNNTG